MPLRETLEKFVPAADKLQHFYFGVLICAAFIILPWWAVITLSIVIGMGLEIYQKDTNTGQFDLMDAVWVTIPSVWFTLIIKLTPWVHNLFY